MRSSACPVVCPFARTFTSTFYAGSLIYLFVNSTFGTINQAKPIELAESGGSGGKVGQDGACRLSDRAFDWAPTHIRIYVCMYKYVYVWVYRTERA